MNNCLTFCSFLVLLMLISNINGFSLVRKQQRLPVPAPKFIVNLDDSPIDRWQHIARKYNGSLISNWLNSSIREVLPNPEVVHKFIKVLENNLDTFFGVVIADEMRGLSKGFGIDLGDVILINVVYDLTAFNTTKSKACTSIVAENSNGEIYHGRNLDYYGPAFMRGLTADIDFQKNGTTLYRGTTFVGYLGLITGVKPGAFSITGNQRDTKHMVSDIFASLLHSNLDFILLRKVLENVNSYNEALNFLSNEQIMAPVYYIIGGVKRGEGAIIVRDPSKTVKVIHMRNETTHPWFVLETNYEPWEQPPKTDNRRDPGIKAMLAVKQSRIGLGSMLEVLTTLPVLNDETVYSTVMSPTNSNIYQTLIRYDAPLALLNVFETFRGDYFM